MLKMTPLHATHAALGAKLVDFGGWEMPLHYGSQIEEHHVVRASAGLFDVSHMRVLDCAGGGAFSFLSHLLANDVRKISRPGAALYSCMLNDDGGVIDDLIVYATANGYRIVVNAGTAESDLSWIRSHAENFAVEISDRRDLAIIAVQGPAAVSIAAPLFGADAGQVTALSRFEATLLGDRQGWYCARTGYTGEDGFELMLPSDQVVDVWGQLVSLGVRPCGLGARDTLRLEAGMSLYGHELDAGTTPLESGLAWTVAMSDDRPFVGRSALESQIRNGLKQRQVGLVLEDRGVLRAEMPVHTNAGLGIVTSGTYSPTLGLSIALARVPIASGDQVLVDVRGKMLRARVVPVPFVRRGKSLVGNSTAITSGENA